MGRVSKRAGAAGAEGAAGNRLTSGLVNAEARSAGQRTKGVLFQVVLRSAGHLCHNHCSITIIFIHSIKTTSSNCVLGAGGSATEGEKPVSPSWGRLALRTVQWTSHGDCASWAAVAP